MVGLIAGLHVLVANVSEIDTLTDEAHQGEVDLS